MSETQQGAPRGRHRGGSVSAELRAALRRIVDETASEADWHAIVAWIRAAPGEGRLDVVRVIARANQRFRQFDMTRQKRVDGRVDRC